MFGIILASMIAFLSTSIDDLFILTLHFATSNEKFSKKDIVYGHFSGIAFLISIFEAFAGSVLSSVNCRIAHSNPSRTIPSACNPLRWM